MTKDLGSVWMQFDTLIGQSESADTKALIAAIRLQTEFLNQRLSQIETNTGYQIHKDLRQSYHEE